MNKNQISILLPTFNCSCKELVNSLQQQCADRVEYEIIVADDGSTEKRWIEENKVIESLPHVSYLVLHENVGRAAIRNFLARQAHYPWLLFIDGDISLDNPHFIQNYIQSRGEVVVGGLTIGGDPQQWGNNLRYRYEKACEEAHNAENRQTKAHQEFRTTNFLIHRDILLQHPFDEQFHYYGYEDVLFGKELQNSGITIQHINNPVLLDDYENNTLFLEKTEEALRTLYTFRQQLSGYSTLLRHVKRLERLKMLPLVNFSYKMTAKGIKRQLQGNNPKVFLFTIYKLMYFVHLIKQQKT